MDEMLFGNKSSDIDDMVAKMILDNDANQIPIEKMDDVKGLRDYLISAGFGLDESNIEVILNKVGKGKCLGNIPLQKN